MFTRSNPIGTEAEQKVFTPGDQIRINNGSKDADYVLSDDGETWKPATDNDVLIWEKDNMTFTAFYPANVKNELEGFDNTFTYGSVQIGQMTKEGLAKSDYMTATTTVSKNPKDHTLSLNFERKTARVIVEIAGYNDQYNSTDNPVVGVSLYGAVNTYGSPMGVITYNVTTGGQPGAGNKFVALFFPTYAEPNSEFITVYVEGEERPLRVTGIPKLEAGKSYTFKLVVGKDKATIQSVTVNDWGDGGVIPGGPARKKEKTVRLGTDVNDYGELKSWLDSNIGDKTGYTVVVKGEWNEYSTNYFQDITNFTIQHKDADMTVDLSGLTKLTSIPSYAFLDSKGAVGLTGIILPSSVTSIGNMAFENTGLKSINLPEGITSIGFSAFFRTHITTLDVPSSFKKIGDEAFGVMTELKEIRFKGNVESFGNRVFNNDTSLQSIYLDQCTSVPSVKNNTFSDLAEGQKITVYVMNESMKTAFDAADGWNNPRFSFEVAK